MKKVLLSCLLSVLCFTGVYSQSLERPFALGVFGGLTQYNGDLGQGFYDFSQAAYGHIGLQGSWYLTSHWDFSMYGGYGQVGYVENEFKSFRAKQAQFDAHFTYNIRNTDTKKLIPYLIGGVGAAYYYNFTAKEGFDFFPRFGAGVRYKVNDRISLHLQEAFNYSDHDDHDNDVHGDNDAFVMHSVGITYSFSGGKDSDKDGVNDKRDNCPNTPLGVTVDFKGCPADRDGDNIPDYQDQCPDIKGSIALKGCPDRDNDGIADSLDKCPDIAGTLALKGCPDRDGDNIADAEDKCPDVFGTAELQGCPVADRDKDGIADAEDKCPDVKGTVAAQGCPDKDGDGIADADDKCPDQPGVPANFGCPMANTTQPSTGSVSIPSTSNEKINHIIYFETGSDNITSSSKRTLDKVVMIMKANTNNQLEIDGHTDNQGDEASNMTLSQKRAEIVKSYLVKKGIDGSRLSTNGFGQTQPVADNNTAAGKAKNRRVEFKIK